MLNKGLPGRKFGSASPGDVGPKRRGEEGLEPATQVGNPVERSPYWRPGVARPVSDGPELHFLLLTRPRLINRRRLTAATGWERPS